MSGYTVINILDMPETVGEDELSSILSDFSCPRNPEIEHFIHNNAIEFDKTGILTYGTPAVSDIICIDGMDEQDIWIISESYATNRGFRDSNK